MKKFFKYLGKRIKKFLNLQEGIRSRHIFVLALLVCLLLIAISFFSESSFKPFRIIANYTVVPMKVGLNRIGTLIGEGTGALATYDELREENEELKKQVELLENENARLLQDDAELKRLQELYSLEEAYGNYNKVAARIISRDSSNWFNKFTIDKGSRDGIEVNMNVLASGGLVGIVTDVGPDYATVRAIIDDNSNVSAMTLTTNDICYVKGDLTKINEGTIQFTDMPNNSNEIYKGETLVTSNISSKFLPGIVIGYISSIKVDSNNLTRSGVLVPAVDFAHLQEVLVITDLKSEIATLNNDSDGENADYYDITDNDENTDEASQKNGSEEENANSQDTE